MIKDIIEIKNIFDNPDRIVEFAKLQTYYNQKDFTSKTKHAQLAGAYPQWQGYRTEMLHLVNNDFFLYSVGNIIRRSLEETFTKKTDLPFVPNFNFISSSYFHYSTKEHRSEEHTSELQSH